MLCSGMCCALGQISKQATTTNVLAEAYQRAKPTAARGGTNTLGNHKLLHPFRNSRVVVCGSSVKTELVKVATSSISETQLENHNWRHTNEATCLNLEYDPLEEEPAMFTSD
ncbi:hypothetical protein Tco_1291295 [Tanacetum coccineum]